MKKGFIIFGSLMGVAFASWAVWRFVLAPKHKFSFPNIDWDKKVVNYDSPLGKGTVDYTSLLDPTKSVVYKSDNADMSMNIYAGSNSIIFSFYYGKDNRGYPQMTDRQIVDFTTKKTTDFTSPK